MRSLKTGDGILVGFDGKAINTNERCRERPPGSWLEDDRSALLPCSAYQQGCRLISFYPPRRSGVDPYVLFDKLGHILYQWPDDYMPSWAEVADVCP